MAKNDIKTVTTAEQYLVDVVSPRIETIEESLESLRDNQTTMLNSMKESNDALADKFEKAANTKAQGNVLEILEKKDVENTLKRILTDELVQRTITVNTQATASLSEKDSDKIGIMIRLYEKWLEQSLEQQKAYQNSRRPLIHITFTKKWVIGILVLIFCFSMYAIGKVHYNVRQTPEMWCHRAYRAAVTMGIENPGDAYHQAMLDFESGDADSARESVREKEIEARASTIRKNKSPQKF